jgi:hypothetical protein
VSFAEPAGQTASDFFQQEACELDSAETLRLPPEALRSLRGGEGKKLGETSRSGRVTFTGISTICGPGSRTRLERGGGLGGLMSLRPPLLKGPVAVRAQLEEVNQSEGSQLLGAPVASLDLAEEIQSQMMIHRDGPLSTP